MLLMVKFYTVGPNVKDFSDVKAVTKPINSNLNGLKSRASVFNKV